MPVEISAQQKKNYLLISVSGVLENLEELKNLSVQFYEQVIQYETRNVVIDELQLKLTNSIMHQVELIKYYSDNLPPEIKNYKVAVAVDPKYKDLAEFWNLYGTNRGFPWKGFTSLEEALEWIKLDEG